MIRYNAAYLCGRNPIRPSLLSALSEGRVNQFREFTADWFG